MAVDVDVIVAVHDPARRIDRSVGSALTSSCVSRVIIVCHNTSKSGIQRQLGPLANDARVRLLELHDDIRSPAGPFNYGLAAAEASFFAIMGSDDELAPGAIDAWASKAHQARADMVIPPIRIAGAGKVPTPPVRPFRRTMLEGVADRLCYRTAPLGLISRQTFGMLRFTPKLATGEDLEFSTRIWFSGASIARAARGAEYIVHDDAVRVTAQIRPVAEDLAAVDALIAGPVVDALAPEARVSLAVKLWRISVFGAAHYRAGRWVQEDREQMAKLVGRLTCFEETALEALSIADRRLVDALANSSVPNSAVDAAESLRRRFYRPAALFPRRLARFLGRDSPLRYFVSTYLARHS